MAFDTQVLGNDSRIQGSLIVDSFVQLGFSTTGGADRAFNAVGALANINFLFTPKGTGTLKVPVGYAANISSDEDIVNRGYANTKLLGNDVNALVITPTIAQNGFAIVWDNTAGEYILAAAASSKTFGSGLEDVANVIKLGGTPLDRNTDITGAFNFRLGTTVAKLSNIELNATTRVDVVGGTSKLILNGANPVELIGGTALSSIIFDAGGGITLKDNQGGAAQRGLRGDSSYAGQITDLDYTQKTYVDSRIGGKSVDSIIKTPTVAQHGYAIIWNNSTLQYTLANISPVGTSTIPKIQTFLGDGITTVWEITSGVILYNNFVEINGNIQTEGTDYTLSGQFLTVTPALVGGATPDELTIRFWEDLSVGGGGGGGGGGHVIQNSGVSIAQRANLNFTNGISATDIATVSTVKIGGAFTENTIFNGVDTYSLTYQNLVGFTSEANTHTLFTPAGATLIIGNTTVQRLELGIEASGKATFNLGGDAIGDQYQRDATNKLTRVAIGSADHIWTSNGTIGAWAPLNLASIPSANETTQGKIEIANQSEANLGTDDTRAMTPLKTKVKNRLSSTITGNTLIDQADDQRVFFANAASAVIFTFPVLEAGTYLSVIQVGAGDITWAASGTSFTGATTSLPGGVSGLNVTFYYLTTTSILVIAGNITALSNLIINGGLALKAGFSAGAIAKVGGVIFTDTTTIGNVTTGDDTLKSYTLPVNILFVDKQTINATCSGTFAATGNNKRIRVKYGATTIFDSGAMAISIASSWVVELEIIRTSFNTEKCNVRFICSDPVAGAKTSYSTAAENTTGTSLLAVTGEATATNDIVSEMFKVRWESHE